MNPDDQPNPPSGPLGGSRPAASRMWQAPSVEEMQAMLPQYEILEILGRGGMGAVYKGRQKSLKRLVAIKILPPDAADDEMRFIERFENEAQTMAAMNHPAIVAVYDFGESAGGLLYFIMEYVDGTDVQKMIQANGKLGDDYALAIAAHVCDALDYAHSRGVIHRDIKPANILIDQEGRVKVADFGLAKMHDPSLTSGLTRTNMAMGTPDYVAPEVLTMDVIVDHRADLYAVGVMLYQMLTGEVPRGMFRMPSEKGIGSDPRFDEIICKAMEQDRDHRYQTAGEVRRSLDEILTTPQPKNDGTGVVPVEEIPKKVVLNIPGASLKRSGGAPAGGAPARSEGPPPKKAPGKKMAGKGAPGKGAPSKKASAPAGKSATGLWLALAGGVAALGIAGFFVFGGKPQPVVTFSEPARATPPAAPRPPVTVRENPPGTPSANHATASLASTPPARSTPDPALARATKDAPFENSLGMKFVPVPITGGPTDAQRVLFSIWETRAQDYQTFVTETKRKWRKWSKSPHPKFELHQRPAEAVAFVSWIDAQEFAAWLTERERKSGLISDDLAYRLPTDHEWSCAAGVGEREDPTLLPKAKMDKFLDVFPWGAGWPPPPGVGNFSDQTAKAQGVYVHPSTSQQFVEGYDDGHAFIAPVGSFLPNEHGLHDLAGNLTELCEDWFDAEQTTRVQRNTSWASHTANTMASSWRASMAETGFSHTVGFRLVLVPAATVAPIAATLTPAAATKEVRFVNELGMKFVPVPISGGPTGGQRVLFSVWETRVRDYERFLSDTKREWSGPEQSPHPRFRWPQAGSTEAAVYVSWLDAKAFAEWLTQKDHTAGRIGGDLAYRLPTDHEWSCAVGLGENEDPAIPPTQKGELFPDVFPWGTSWPPPLGAGNLADQTARAAGVHAHPESGQEFIEGYDDGHAFIAPAGSFQPNVLGLHDLAGNVAEYVADWSERARNERVVRGAHWGESRREFVTASFRNARAEDGADHLVGFRVVLAPAEVAAP